MTSVATVIAELAQRQSTKLMHFLEVIVKSQAPSIGWHWKMVTKAPAKSQHCQRWHDTRIPITCEPESYNDYRIHIHCNAEFAILDESQIGSNDCDFSESDCATIEYLANVEVLLEVSRHTFHTMSNVVAHLDSFLDLFQYRIQRKHPYMRPQPRIGSCRIRSVLNPISTPSIRAKTYL